MSPTKNVTPNANITNPKKTVKHVQYLTKKHSLQKEHRLSHIHTLHQHLFTEDQQAKKKLERNAEVLVLSFLVPLTQAA